MAKNSRSGEINKSAEIRKLITQNPEIKLAEVINTLGKRNIEVKPGLFYFTKGKMKGTKGRRNKARQMVENVSATMSTNGPTNTSDVVATIIKVKHLAAEVGGLKKLKALVEALGE